MSVKIERKQGAHHAYHILALRFWLDKASWVASPECDRYYMFGDQICTGAKRCDIEANRKLLDGEKLFYKPV